MIEHDKLVSECKVAIRSMREGSFDLSVPANLGESSWAILGKGKYLRFEAS